MTTLVANPGLTAVTATVTFLRTTGAPIQRTIVFWAAGSAVNGTRLP